MWKYKTLSIELTTTQRFKKISFNSIKVIEKKKLTENWLDIIGDGSQVPGVICHCLNSPLKPLDMLPLLQLPGAFVQNPKLTKIMGKRVIWLCTPFLQVEHLGMQMVYNCLWWKDRWVLSASNWQVNSQRQRPQYYKNHIWRDKSIKTL